MLQEGLLSLTIYAFGVTAVMALHQVTRVDSPDKCLSSSNKRGREVLTVEPAVQTKASKAMLQPGSVLKVLHVGCCTIKCCLQAAHLLCSRRLLQHRTARRRQSLSTPAFLSILRPGPQDVFEDCCCVSSLCSVRIERSWWLRSP